MKTVAILMSTYNGEKYLPQQLDSLFAQKGIELKIVVRDDGSSDSTVEILHQYASKHPDFTILEEDNCGAVMSFHKLCQYANEHIKADYYAFCDQDDVWLPEKLQIAIKRLEVFNPNSPNLYFSNLQMVNADLTPLRKLFAKGEVVISKRMALIQVFTYGCTCVFNHSALDAYCQADFSKELGHDNWIYIVSMFLGNVYYDENSYILYRQHGTNVSGAKVSGIKLACQRIRRGLFGYWGNDFELYSSMLLSSFSKRLLPNDRKYIERVAYYRKTWWKKMLLLLSPTYSTGKPSKDIAIKIRILTNHL